MAKTVLPILDRACVLSLRSEPAVSVGPQREIGGQPVRRFRKTLVRAGNFVKPAEGLAFSVTEEKLQNWAAQFSQMTRNGVKVPVPVGHTFDPEANRGYVVDMLVEGDGDGAILVGLVDLVGDGIKLAGTNDVSIYTVPEWFDGEGRKYQWPIRHVALCTDPVVPGLGHFEAIAASQGNTPAAVPILRFQMEGSSMPDTLTTPAAPNAGDPSEAIVQAIMAKVTSLVKDATQTPQQKKAAFGDLMKQLEKALGVFGDTSTPEPPKPPADGGVLPIAASHTPDPMLVRLTRENRQQKLDNLVMAGHITPASRDKLAIMFLPADDKALSLSMGQSDMDRFDAIVAAMKETRSIDFSHKTGPQVRGVALGNPLNGEKEVEERRKEAGKELAAMTASAAGMRPAKV